MTRDHQQPSVPGAARASRLAFTALALALAACSPEFDPASKVDKLRVLAIRADPPEIAPAPASGEAPVAPDRAALGSLVLRADFATDPARQTTIVYLACLQPPGDPTPNPCVALASLRDATAVLAEAARAGCSGAAGAAPSTVFPAGAEVCTGGTCAPLTVSGVSLPAPELVIPSDWGCPPGSPDRSACGFAALPASAPERILGVQAVVLAFALDATPDELAQGAAAACPGADVAARLSALWATREHVIALKRVQIRGPAAPDAPNANPATPGIAVNGAALAEGTATPVPQGALTLTTVLPADADALRPTYTKLDAAGVPIETKREDWVYAWFSTAGELDHLHTRDPDAEPWTVSVADAPPGGHALIATVLRDLRGGISWAVREVAITP
jgi:hypothetical protein